MGVYQIVLKSVDNVKKIISLPLGSVELFLAVTWFTGPNRIQTKNDCLINSLLNCIFMHFWVTHEDKKE